MFSAHTRLRVGVLLLNVYVYFSHTFQVIRSNMEEVVLQGPEGDQDIRIVNSYPSKVLYIYFMIIVLYECCVIHNY